MATISPTLIANMALSHVGASSTIESLDENSPEAKICKIWYDFSRLQALAGNDWGFARKRLTLGLHGDAAPAEWDYRYQYPADCVSARRIYNPLGRFAPPVSFAIELGLSGNTKSILTDQEDAILVYTRDASATGLFSPYFVELLSYIIAHHIAYSLTQKPSLRSDMFTIYTKMLQKAPAIDANEEVGDQPPDADWITGR